MPYQSKFSNEDIESLYEAILKLENPEECHRFFEDICTINEIFEMAQRLKVAKMLDAGMPYHQIVSETKASTATISRVSKSLTYGAEGYHAILKKLKDEKK